MSKFIVSEIEKKKILNLYKVKDIVLYEQKPNLKPKANSDSQFTNYRVTDNNKENIAIRDNSRSVGEFSKTIKDFIYKYTVNKIKKSGSIAIIFPNMMKKSEKLAYVLNFLDKIVPVNLTGFSAFVLRNINEFKTTIDNISKLNVKVNKLIIGSHGNGSHLLMTTSEDGKHRGFNQNEYIKHLTSIIVPNETIVYFTSCYGANSLVNLYAASIQLKTKCYASAGVNYLGFASQKGFFMCENRNLFTLKSKGDKINLTNDFLIENGFCKPVKDVPFWFVLPSNMSNLFDIDDIFF